jgi:serine/threonine protein kinase
VQVLGVSDAGDRFYLVMELMKTSLERIAGDPEMRSKLRDDSSVAKEFALQIAAGMSHLEAEGICHRDVRDLPSRTLAQSLTQF